MQRVMCEAMRAVLVVVLYTLHCNMAGKRQQVMN